MTNNMTVGNPWLVMLKFALPMAIGNFLQQLYNISDTIIIGKLLGEEALAAVGEAGNITFLLVALAAGLGAGVSVIISNHFGAGETGRLKTALFTGLITSVVSGIIITAIFVVGNGWLLKKLNTPDELLAFVQGYLIIYTYGIIFIFIFNVCSAFFQAQGDSKTPLYILILSSVMNIALDLFFISKLKSGIFGAAYATVISEFISMCISFFIVYLRLRNLSSVKDFRYFDFRELRNIGCVAIPSILQQSVISLGIILMQSLINSYGTIVIAAYTSATKIVNIIGSPMANMGNAVSTFAAQNIGAGKKERIRLGIRAALIMNMMLSVLIISIICFKGEFLLGLFVNKSDYGYNEIIETGMEYLIIICFGNPIFGCMHVFSGALRGIRNMVGFTACFIFNMTVRIVVAYLLSGLIGRKGIWYAVIAGWIFGLLTAVISYYKDTQRTLQSKCLRLIKNRYRNVL